jgi:hypothetical protein
MFSRANALIAVMAAIIAVLAWALVYYARDELELTAEHAEEEIETPSAAAESGGFAVVRVSAESQKASGIQTAALDSRSSSCAGAISPRSPSGARCAPAQPTVAASTSA